jgi:2-C-methyl-D-erythritol 4-phosphate cytidylyltransferase
MMDSIVFHYMGNAYYQSQQLICHNTSLIQNHYTLNVILKVKAEEETNNIRDVPKDNNIVVGGETRISDKVFL